MSVHAYTGAHKWMHTGQKRMDLYTRFQLSMTGYTHSDTHRGPLGHYPRAVVRHIEMDRHISSFPQRIHIDIFRTFMCMSV